MESSHGLHVLEVIENKFNELLKNPEIYIAPQPKNTEDFKQLSKQSYAIAFSNNKLKGKCLPQLLIHGFDEEQLWQQSDLLNKAASSNISQIARDINLKNINLTVSKSQQLEQSVENIDNLENKEALKNDNSDDGAENSGDEVDDDNNEIEDNNIDLQESSGDEEGYAFDDDSDSSAEVGKKVKKKSSSQRKKRYAKSEVDDKFFNLSKLGEFLRIEDIKEEKREEMVEPEEDIDYFGDIPSDVSEDMDEESDEEQPKSKKSSKDLMYEDFFDDPESEVGENNDDSIDENDENMDENNVSLMDQSMKDYESGDSGDEIEDNSTTDIKNNTEKTAFEIEQERTKQQIQDCEKSMLEPLPWQLTGEVDASKRPIDSLMDVEADCDTNKKQDVLVDQELTEKIESITKMAIMNKAFSDVERKRKPTEEEINYKKEVALEQTKSKKGLAEIYEEDFLKKQSKDEEEEDPKHKEIKKLMDSLFPQLNALFSHIPKPAIPEIKIVSNLPAVTVEEVAPTSVSDVTLLAPEEVKKKSGMIKGNTERDETDRKRERRKKKIHQKLKEKKRLEKLESIKSNPSAKISKLEKLDALKKLKQHKNTKIAKVDEGGKIKSSTDFFSRLQDTMDTKKKTKSNVLYKKKNVE